MWSVSRVVGRRLTSSADLAVGRVTGDPPVMEYRLRWSGLGSQYDQWRTNHYLDDIVELVAAYNARHPLPIGHTSLVLAPEARGNPAGQPPPSPAALARRHFRSRPPQPPPATTAKPLMAIPAVLPVVAHDLGYLSTPIQHTPADAPIARVSPVQPLVPTSMAEDETTVPPIDVDGRRHSSRLSARPLGPSVVDIAANAEGDTADPFPTTTRIEVQWPCGNWFAGVVVRSFVTRTRRPARVLKVRYDDSPATGFNHTLTGASHLFRVEPPVRSARLREAAGNRLNQEQGFQVC